MPSNRVTVALFGESPIRIDGKPQRLAVAGPTLSLLHYLLIFPEHSVRREYLAELLWGALDSQRRRAALNSALWRVSKALSPYKSVSVSADRESLRLKLDAAVCVDARVLAEAVRGGETMDKEKADRLANALALCSGPFLGGAVEDWALAERERHVNMRLRGLATMMHWCGQAGRYEDALDFGRSLLDADPFRESAQCEVMWLYVLNRQRAQAIRQYDTYRSLLKRELGVEPMPETRALCAHIRGSLEPVMPGRTQETHSVSGPLDTLFVAIERSRRDVYAALRAHSADFG